MAFQFFKHRWQKVVLITFLIFTALILITGFFVNRYCSPILADKIHTAVLNSSDSLYSADFSSAEFHVLQGKVVVFNITFKIDSTIYKRRKAQGLAPNNLVDLHVKRLVINHVHPFKYFIKHELDIDEIILSAPEIHISYQLNHTKDTVSKDHRTAWQKISKTLHFIHIGNIFLNDVKFVYDDYSGHKLAISELKEMNLHASDLMIDSLTQTDKSRLLYCREIVAELNNYTGKTPSGLYSYTIKYLKFSTLTSQLNAEDVTLSPVKTGVFFDKSRLDKYSAHLESVQLNKFDFLNYHKYRSFSVSSIILNRGTFSLFSNPNGITTNNDKIKSFPNVAISGIKTDMKIDTISIKHLNISYIELNHKSKEIGTVTFNNTSGHFYNITNNKAALQKNNWCSARLTSYFMDKGELSLLVNFNLTDKDAAYTYKGSIGSMDLKALNQATMPLAMVKINSGMLRQFNFDFKANRKISNGRVTILYNNLKVTVLKADTDDQKLKRMRIASLFANIFIIKHNNPDKEGEVPRSFNVSMPRAATTPFFKYTWQSLLTGIKPGVGFDKEKQEATSAMVTKSAIDKQNRLEKKAMRKQRRAERKQKRADKKLQESLKNGTQNADQP